MSDFKDRLKKARARMGIPQSELAREVGVHVTNISRCECDEDKFTSAVLAKLGDAITLSAGCLMCESIKDKTFKTFPSVVPRYSTIFLLTLCKPRICST